MPKKKNRQQNNLVPLLLIGIGAFLVIAVLIWQIAGSAFQTAEPSTSSLVSAADVQRTTIEEAKSAFDQKSAVFVDVRSTSSFANEHINGAVSIPLDQIENRNVPLDKAQWIITYCT